MNNIFESVERTLDEDVFFRRGDPNDVRLGEIVPQVRYEEARVVIVGCPGDEGVRRSGGREGTALAPDAIRREFYKFTPFGISARIFDAGNIKVEGSSLEETHEAYRALVSQILKDGKRVIGLGGGNDVSYPAGAAMAETFGAGNWIATNVDAHFDVRADLERNSETAYRQLLEEKLLRSDYLYEVAYQTQLASPVYYRYLQNLNVNLISLEQLRSRTEADYEVRELMKQKFVNHSSSLNTFFGFDLTAVRMSDAPGVTTPNPTGLRAGELITLVKFAASLINTRIIQFAEVNPLFDIDSRTVKLVAVAMHRFCAALSKKG
ncbi:MAG TPA: formimidoylglutamase [Pyrinomonadaceae bacterium]|nr:formimidoylglutamase [Pyrinomonadaceae bacterium]